MGSFSLFVCLFVLSLTERHIFDESIARRSEPSESKGRTRAYLAIGSNENRGERRPSQTGHNKKSDNNKNDDNRISSKEKGKTNRRGRSERLGAECVRPFSCSIVSDRTDINVVVVVVGRVSLVSPPPWPPFASVSLLGWSPVPSNYRCSISSRSYWKHQRNFFSKKKKLQRETRRERERELITSDKQISVEKC